MRLLQVYFLTKDEGSGRERPYLHDDQVHVFSKTWNMATRLVIADGKMIMPGEDTNVQMYINRRMVSISINESASVFDCRLHEHTVCGPVCGQAMRSNA